MKATSSCEHFSICFRFAFIEFNSEADVDTAMEEKQGTDLEGKSLFLDYTGSKSKGAKKTNTFGGTPQQRKSFGGKLGRTSAKR